MWNGNEDGDDGNLNNITVIRFSRISITCQRDENGKSKNIRNRNKMRDIRHIRCEFRYG